MRFKLRRYELKLRHACLQTISPFPPTFSHPPSIFDFFLVSLLLGLAVDPRIEFTRPCSLLDSQRTPAASSPPTTRSILSAFWVITDAHYELVFSCTSGGSPLPVSVTCLRALLASFSLTYIFGCSLWYVPKFPDFTFGLTCEVVPSLSSTLWFLCRLQSSPRDGVFPYPNQK